MTAPAVIFDLTVREANDLYALVDNVGEMNQDAILRRTLLTAARRILDATAVAEHRGKGVARITLTAVQAHTLQVLSENVGGALDEEDEALYDSIERIWKKIAEAEGEARLRAAMRARR